MSENVRSQRAGFRARASLGTLSALLLIPIVAFPARPLAATPGQPAVGRAGPPPNIVFILTDDQRWDSLMPLHLPSGTVLPMPNVTSLLQNHGMTFQNFFDTNPLCCPSRTTELTGEYSHSTDVYDNGNGTYGGFQAFGNKDTSTIATWLHQAGYATGLIGKYLNGYDVNSGYIPPGWDRWFVIGGEKGGYYNYTASDQGVPVNYGYSESNYSTDVFAGKANTWIRSVPITKPLFLWFAPHAPHGPATPPKRYRDSYRDMPPYRPPNYLEADVTDKPAYVQALPASGAHDPFRQKQYRTLLAVDDAVKTIVDALTAMGRLQNTMIVFSSDNGLTWAEHRLIDTKYTPYEESIRVPLVIRYDPLMHGRLSDDHLVVNVDLAATMADIAGVAHPPTEGLSMLPLFSQGALGAVNLRTDFLIEHHAGTAPPYCGIRSKDYMYTAYATHEEELYDLRADPYELVNQISNPAYASEVALMRARLTQLCSPPPPGDTFVP